MQVRVINNSNFISVNKISLRIISLNKNNIIFVLACLMTLHHLREKVPLHLLGLTKFKKMATKPSAKKTAPAAVKKTAAGATKAKPKGK